MLNRIKRAYAALTAPAPKVETMAVSLAGPGPAPKGQDAIGEAILAQLKAQGLIPDGAGVRITKVNNRTGAAETITDVSASAPAMFNPADPASVEAERQRRESSWEFWKTMMAGELDVFPPDWALCRIGNRHLFDRDQMGWVYGAAKGPFGIWATIYRVCDFEDEGEHQSERALWAVTCIRSGFGLGLFDKVETAIEACGHIESIIDWRKMPDADFTVGSQQAWSNAISRTHAHWEFVGIGVSSTMHCHVANDTHGIWVKLPPEDVATVKKESLS